MNDGIAAVGKEATVRGVQVLRINAVNQRVLCVRYNDDMTPREYIVWRYSVTTHPAWPGGYAVFEHPSYSDRVDEAIADYVKRGG